MNSDKTVFILELREYVNYKLYIMFFFNTETW